jgi:O-antigen/teichoic acid export membrane protein
LPVAAVFQLLAPAALATALNPAANWLCVSRGQAWLQFRFALISAPICVITFIVGIKWGIQGVAAGFSLVFPVLFWAFLWYAAKLSPVRQWKIAAIFFSALLPACVGGLAIWSARQTVLSHVPPLLALCSCAALFLLVYVPATILFKGNRLLIYGVCEPLLRRWRGK